jgi:hypothetical protein
VPGTSVSFAATVEPVTERRHSSNSVLLRVALTLFAAGLLAIAAIFLVPAVGGNEPPLWLYLTAMIAAPLGFVLALVYALMSGRRAR